MTRVGLLVFEQFDLLDVGAPYEVLLTANRLATRDGTPPPFAVEAVRHAAGTVPVLASVCTGAFVLGRADLLAGRTWTTHWEDVDALADEVGHGGRRARWVDDGQVVTGGGLSCGLHLVDRFAGRELAVATARQIDHRCDPDGG